MCTRSMALRADSINEAERSVEAVIATERQVAVFDFERFRMIDEILVMRGLEVPDQVPLLANHRRFDLDDVLGSVRNIRVQGGETFGRLYFADQDDGAERVWNKVRQKHLRDVSVGTRATEWTDIEAGQSDTVGGTRYTAGRLMLRITTKWTIREVSSVVIGADERAKIIRAAQPEACPHCGHAIAQRSRPNRIEQFIQRQCTDTYRAWDVADDLSDASGLTVSNVNRIVRGEAQPTTDQLRAFALVLDTSVDELTTPKG